MSRPWEAFLTPQDRAHLAASRPDSRMGFGQRPALLLIDLYRWVFGDQPEPLLEQIKTWPGSCGLAGWNAIPHIQRLLAASREAGIPIFYSTGMNDPGAPGWAKSSRSGIAKSDDPAMRARRARMNDIIDEVAPRENEVIIRKSSPSAFWGSPLAGHLTFHGIDTVIVCGESTSGCVRSAVVDGCSHRFRMMVVEECVFDRHEMAHALNLFDMDQKYADVIPLADALDYLANLKAGDRTDRKPALVGAR
jgi:nicotinamidase-related amidase